MTLKTQRAVKLQNKCGCIFDHDELVAATIWYSDKPIQSQKRISMHGRYPCVSIGKEKIHIHRLLMMYWCGRRLKASEHVHHKNENKLDARRENLEVVSASAHTSMHNKGKVVGEYQIQRIKESNKKRKGRIISKHAHAPYKEVIEMRSGGMSINKIARYFGVDWSTIKNRLTEVAQNPELIGGEQS